MALAFEAITRDQVLKRFLDLVVLDGPSGREEVVAEYVHTRLNELGLEVAFDNAASKTGGQCGNLFAWWEGTDPAVEPMFFSCHLDTVLSTMDLRPVARDGIVASSGTTILGADDRAALTAYLEGLAAVIDSGARCGPVQLILTVSEQPGLLGARAMDYSFVRASYGYVYDSSGDVGQMILRGPCSDRITMTFRGRKAHLGLAVEEGINAISMAADALVRFRLGRLDEETVASVGVIHGGELPSIVPDAVEVVGEARSLSFPKLRSAIQDMVDVARSAAKDAGGEVDVVVEPKYREWRVDANARIVTKSVEAAELIGVRPYFTDTLGGADTNIFIEHGFECMTLGIGFQKIHSFDEHISIDNLYNAARHVAALIENRGRGV